MRIQNKSMFNRNNNSNKMIPYSSSYSNRNTMNPPYPYPNTNSKTNIELSRDKIANIIPDKNPNEKKKIIT